MRTRAAPPPLAEFLATRLRECGRITFAEFMDLCLYDPEHGYYSVARRPRFADYYTSVDVHPVFGRLLARQFHEMWALLGRAEPFWLVEVGAGTGRLARQILDFAARDLPEFYQGLCYIAVDRSAARRDAQATTLTPHLQAGRAVSAGELPDEIPAGCVFSNELLDALPVHRVVPAQGELREIYVVLDGDKFSEQLGPPSTPALAEYFAAQGCQLAEDQQAEVGLAACAWIEDVGRRIGRGFVVTVDYGHEACELYSERHLRGTLLAYRQHRVGEDFFAAPGEQDLTAHVNFTALDLWGRRGGLKRVGLVSQAHFLLALGRGNEFADLYDEGQSETERLHARLLLKNLMAPQGMGETFQVFIQYKGLAAPRLTGLQPL